MVKPTTQTKAPAPKAPTKTNGELQAAIKKAAYALEQVVGLEKRVAAWTNVPLAVANGFPAGIKNARELLGGVRQSLESLQAQGFVPLRGKSTGGISAGASVRVKPALVVQMVENERIGKSAVQRPLTVTKVSANGLACWAAVDGDPDRQVWFLCRELEIAKGE